MAGSKRRKRSKGQSVDLFSFLNIMTATIGVQTLLLVVFALQIKPAFSQYDFSQQVVQVPVNKGTIYTKNGDLEILESGKKIQKTNINHNEIDVILDRINNQSKPYQ